jgi:AbiU2
LDAAKPGTRNVCEHSKRPKRIAEFKPLTSFKLRRNKFQAHFDKEYFFERNKLHKDAPLAWGDLEQVVQLGKEILNSYSADYDGNTHAVELEPINAGDVDHLLDRLHVQIQKKPDGTVP